MAEVTNTRPASSAPPAPPRPEMRSEDPRRDAAARAKEIMEHLGSFEENVDEFWIDPAIVPDGWTYEWRVLTVNGAIDQSKQIDLARKGWEPVPTKRHPEMMPHNSTEKNIIRKGMQLMERPKQVTEMAQQHMQRQAAIQMQNKKAQIEGAPIGPFGRDNSGRPIVVNGARGVRSDFSLTMKVPD